MLSTTSHRVTRAAPLSRRALFRVKAADAESATTAGRASLNSRFAYSSKFAQEPQQTLRGADRSPLLFGTLLESDELLASGETAANRQRVRLQIAEFLCIV